VPIRALRTGKLIDGWQRVEAAKESGWKFVPTIFVDVRPEAELHWILLYNSQRIKSIPDRLREFRAYLKIERDKASERVGIRTDLDQGLPEGHTQFGKSHELAAKKVGLSGTSARNGLRVLEEIERRGESDGTEKALKILTERGINAAWKFAYSHGWIDASVKPKKRRESKRCGVKTQATATELKDDSAPRSEDASEKTLPIAGWMTDDLIDDVITDVAPTDSEGADILRKTISYLRPTSAPPKTGKSRLSKLQLVRSLVPRAAEVLPDRHIAEPLEALSELVVRLDAIIGSVRPSDRKLGARALAALRVVDPKRAEAFAEAAVGTALAQAIAEAEAPTGSTTTP
jgi:ParB-like chromosome segregation protein Spo0J